MFAINVKAMTASLGSLSPAIPLMSPYQKARRPKKTLARAKSLSYL